MKRAQWHRCADLESDGEMIRWWQLRAGRFALNVHEEPDGSVDWTMELQVADATFGCGKEKTVQLAKRAAKTFARKLLTEALEKLG